MKVNHKIKNIVNFMITNLNMHIYIILFYILYKIYNYL